MKQIFKPFIGIVSIFFVLTSCEEFIDTGAPEKELTPDLVFTNDKSATAAVLGIYTDLWDFGYEVARFTGRSGDEFENFSSDLSLEEFYLNQLRVDNNEIENLWKKLFKPIYAANAVLEGLSKSIGVSPQTKAQLEGESRFLRAFCYFHLVNLFGEVPLITQTDYRMNAVKPQSSPTEIYDLIANDLTIAKDLLGDNYITVEKVRANGFSVLALLSRVYLYRQNWAEAENTASLIIDGNKYSLEDLSEVFLANNDEAILQFYPVSFYNTREGDNFILTSTPPGTQAFSDQLINSFEPDDLRFNNWVGQITSSGGATYHYPFKYKLRFNQNKSEYSVVLRLAEQYLIRAEARTRQNNISGALTDLDVIRNRAGLPLIQDVNPEIDKMELLLVIENERKLELFTEWGHRWFDLKRTSQAEAILVSIKADWQNTDQLYPIPLREINTNPKLIQNEGY